MFGRHMCAKRETRGLRTLAMLAMAAALVLPGAMREAVAQVTESTFFKRYGTLDEQIAPILFLASDEAGYITGAVLPVAGGDNG